MTQPENTTEDSSGTLASMQKTGLEIQKSAQIVLVTGDRYWRSQSVILNELSLCGNLKTLIEGDAYGADRISADMARRILRLKDIRVFKADWGAYGRSAGPIRNREMLKENPDLVLAFHDDLEGKSKGTKDMVKISIKAGIPVKHVTSKGEVRWFLPEVLLG